MIFTHYELTLESVEFDRINYASSQEFRSGKLSDLLKKKIILAREAWFKRTLHSGYELILIAQIKVIF